MKNYYAILGVSRSAGGDDIREAYRELVKQCHPDSSMSETTVPEFLDVQEAYDVLRDDVRRREYDRRLGSGSSRRVSADPARDRPNRGGPARNRPGRSEFAGRPLEALDLILDPGEARRGGRFFLPVRGGSTCPVCAGSGRVFVFSCSLCRGTGRIGSSLHVGVTIPPGCRTGDRILGYSIRGSAVAEVRVVIV